MLEKFPQMSKRGAIQYLLAGGWAVELLTGSKREHEDIDVFCVDEDYLSTLNTSIGPGFVNDERAAIFYAHCFGNFSTRLIKKHYTQEVEIGNRKVVIPSTEFLLLFKLFLPLREKDAHDVAAIFNTQQINPGKLANILRTIGYTNPQQRAHEIVNLNYYKVDQLKDYQGIRPS